MLSWKVSEVFQNNIFSKLHWKTGLLWELFKAKFFKISHNDKAKNLYSYSGHISPEKQLGTLQTSKMEIFAIIVNGYKNR